MKAKPMDLFRYFPSYKIEAAETIGPEIRLVVGPNNSYGYDVDDRLVKDLAGSGGITEFDQSIALMEILCLHRFLMAGPVIAIPSHGLCVDLVETDVRLTVRDFRVPYEIIAVELPQPIAGPLAPYLIFLWRVSETRLVMWADIGKTGFILHRTIDAADETIEERLMQLDAVGEPDREDARILQAGMRIAINVALLMAHRGYELTDLPAKVLRHRRGNDGRLRRLGNRVPQQIVLRHLKPSNRPPVSEQGVGGTGVTTIPHRVRGHWKQVAYGAKHSLRKTEWIEPYWTGAVEAERPSPPTTIYRD